MTWAGFQEGQPVEQTARPIATFPGCSLEMTNPQGSRLTHRSRHHYPSLRPRVRMSTKEAERSSTRGLVSQAGSFPRFRQAFPPVSATLSFDVLMFVLLML